MTTKINIFHNKKSVQTLTPSQEQKHLLVSWSVFFEPELILPDGALK